MKRLPLACVAVLVVSACTSSKSSLTASTLTPSPSTSHLASPPASTSASTSSRPGPSTSAAASPTAVRTGCNTPAGTYRYAVNGRTIVVALPRPTSPPPATGRGVVLALHGYQGDAADFATYSRLATTAPAAGVVAIFPQGAGQPAGWNYPQRTTVGGDDVAFLDAVLTQLRITLCADLSRVALTGWSDGADMAVTYACFGHHPLRGLLAVAAASGPDQTKAKETCLPRSVVYVHGTADPVESYQGGSQDSRPGYGGGISVGPKEATRRWAGQLTCPAFAHSPTRNSLTVDTAKPCKAGGLVKLITVEGGGHGWPGSSYDIGAQYGPTNHTLNTAAEVLALLS